MWRTSLWLWTVGAVAHAQTTQGMITGRVLDAVSGKPVPASITIGEGPADPGRQTTTDAAGYYVLPLLSPGTYYFRVTAESYQPRELYDLELPVASRLDLPIQLRRASDVWEAGVYRSVFFPNTETVLTFFGPDFDPSRVSRFSGGNPDKGALGASISAVIDPKQLRVLPLAGRDAYTVLAVQPAVTTDAGTSRGLGLSANGQRPSASSFLLDGIENNNNLVTGPLTALSPESILEYRVSISTFSAEYGSTSGYLANAVTRPGGSAWHGVTYFHLGNDALNANTFQNNLAGLERSPFKQAQYGFQVGGPLPGRRFSVSGSWDRLRTRGYQEPIKVRVPSTDELVNAGPLGKQLLTDFPTPTTDFGTGLFSLITVRPPVSLDRGLGLARLDYAPAPAHRLMARLAVNRFTAADFIWSPFRDFVSPLTQPLTGIAASAIDSFGPAVTQEVRFGFSRYTTRWDRAHPEIPTLLVGVSTVTGPYTDISQPTLLPGSLAAYGLRQTSRDWQLQDSWTWTHGRHVAKAGGGLLFRGMDGLQTTGRDGLFVFPTIAFFRTTSPSLYRVSIDRGSLPLLRTPVYDREYRARQWQLFGEDTWKVSRRLVVNTGLRYENFGTPTNTGALQDARLVLAPGTTIAARLTKNFDYSNPERRPQYSADNRDFAGRVGASYDLTGSARSLLRGGYGIFYDRPFDNLWLNLRNNNLVTPAFDLGIPCSPSAVCRNYLSPASALLANFRANQVNPEFPNPTVIDPDLRTGYVHSYFAGWQQELRGGWFADLNLLGSRGRRLITTDIVNRANSDGVRDVPALGDISYRANQGWSDYRALTLLARRRWSGGFFQAAYTWSHATDIQSDPLAGDFADFTFVNFTRRAIGRSRAAFAVEQNPDADFGNADFDQRHNVVLYGYWQVPPLLRGSRAGLLLRHWSLGGVAAFRSGLPFSVQAGDGNGIINQRANRVDTVPATLSQEVTGGRKLLSAAAFSEPASGVLGNTARNAFYGPGLYNVDLSVGRAFSLPWLRESAVLTTRADFFNAFNHANLGNPNPLWSSSQFGVGLYGRQGRDSGFPALVPFTESPRQVQLMLRLEF